MLPRSGDVKPLPAAFSSSIQPDGGGDNPSLHQRNRPSRDVVQQTTPAATPTTTVHPENQLHVIRHQIALLRERNAAMVHETNALRTADVGGMARAPLVNGDAVGSEPGTPVTTGVSEADRRDSPESYDPLTTPTRTTIPWPAHNSHSNSTNPTFNSSPETTHQQRIDKFTRTLDHFETLAQNNTTPSVQELQDAEEQSRVLLESENRHLHQAPGVPSTPVSVLLKRLRDALLVATEMRTRETGDNVDVNTSSAPNCPAAASSTTIENERTTHEPTPAPATSLYLSTSPDGNYRALIVPGRDLIDLNARVHVPSHTRIHDPQATATIQDAPSNHMPQTTPAQGVGAQFSNAPNFSTRARPQTQAQGQGQEQTQAQTPMQGQHNARGYIVIMFNTHHILRRIWLFIRLYFFSYLITHDDSWQRVFFLWFSAAVAYLSDSDVSSWAYDTFLRPVLAHFESLVPLDHRVVRRQRGNADAQRRASGVASGNGNGNRQASMATQVGREEQTSPTRRSNASGTDTTDIPATAPSRTTTTSTNTATSRRELTQTSSSQLTGFQSFERSVALFLASLVPGVGERHVAAVNEANAQVERERLDNEDHERERERQREEQVAVRQQRADE